MTALRTTNQQTEQCDVVVIGGGVTGVVAALAAARTGAKTVLIEARTFVGGNATSGLCLHNYISRQGEQVVYGIAQEIVDELIANGGAVGHIPYGGFVHSVTPVDGDLFRFTVTDLLHRAGVTIRYGAQVLDVDAQDGHVTSLTYAAKGGLWRIEAAAVVDSSGDADVAVAAGADSRQGEEGTKRMQPVSMLLRCFGTDNMRIADAIAVSPPAMAHKDGHDGAFPVYFNGSFAQWNDVVARDSIFPNQDHKVFFNTVWPDAINVNTSAVMGLDGADHRQLSRATIDLTSQLHRISAFLKDNVPGFERAHFIPAVFPGVRETRHVTGLYEVNDEDVREGRRHHDSIGRACFPVDIHDPETGQAEFYPIGGEGFFDLPYRSLVPRGLSNVLVAGRCSSATTFAFGATRNMAPCMVMGQAAGTAAALAAAYGISIADVDVPNLQDRLKQDGVLI